MVTSMTIKIILFVNIEVSIEFELIIHILHLRWDASSQLALMHR